MESLVTKFSPINEFRIEMDERTDKEGKKQPCVLISKMIKKGKSETPMEKNALTNPQQLFTEGPPLLLSQVRFGESQVMIS